MKENERARREMLDKTEKGRQACVGGVGGQALRQVGGKVEGGEGSREPGRSLIPDFITHFIHPERLITFPPRVN